MGKDTSNIEKLLLQLIASNLVVAQALLKASPEDPPFVKENVLGWFSETVDELQRQQQQPR